MGTDQLKNMPDPDFASSGKNEYNEKVQKAPEIMERKRQEQAKEDEEGGSE
jgi:hypothetical protein